MAEVGDVISNPAARMTLRFVRTAGSTDGELLEMEATYEPSSNAPPAHLHPAQDERFEIRAGAMRLRLGEGDERDVGAGEVIEIPRGAAHTMWNAGDEPAVVLWQTRPALRTEEFFETVAKLARGEDAGIDGARVLDEYADVFRLANTDL
jgi:mannose-6-phosphate isomerase-like protein (cupin superfamily)